MESAGARFSPDEIARVATSLNSVRFKDRTGEIEFFGEKAILLRRDAVKAFRKEMEMHVGVITAAFMLRMAGRSIGAREGTLLEKSAKENGFADGGVDHNFLTLTLGELNMGFGKITLTEVDRVQKRAVVKVENCFEATENGPAEKENCYFTQGFLEGLFTGIFGEKVKTRETGCQSKGAAACNFSIAPKTI